MTPRPEGANSARALERQTDTDRQIDTETQTQRETQTDGACAYSIGALTQWRSYTHGTLCR